MTSNPDEVKLKNYFIRKLKTGTILSNNDLRKYVKNRKLKVSLNYIREIRDNVIPTLLYKRPASIKVYQTITVDRLGLLSMDFANYRNEWKRFNSGYIGFLMVNSVIANKWHAIPMKTHDTSEFERALAEICKGGIFPVVSVILSDRETAITSRNFREKMYKKYGIKFQFIHRLNKAWSSESAIYHVKRGLSMALRSEVTSGGKNWIKLLPEVINSHNRQKIEGTNFTPNDINSKNFFEFINELHDTKDRTMHFSTTSIDSRSIKNKQWIKKLFKFRLGEKVFASKYSLEGRKIFGKQSIQGTYSDIPFLIKRAKLRETKDKTLVPGRYII